MPKPANTATPTNVTWNPNSMIDRLMGEPPPPAPTPAPAPAPAPTPAPTPAPAPAPTPAPAPAAPAPAPAPAASAAPKRAATPLPSAAAETPDIPESVLPSAEPAPAASADEGDDDPIPASVTDAKGKNAWTGIRAEKKALKQERDQLKARLTELEAKLTSAPKLPETQVLLDLQNQISEYEQKLGRYDLTATKAFRTRFEMPAEQVKGRATALLRRAGYAESDAAAMFERIVGTTDAQEVQALLAEQPVHVQGALFNLVTEFDQIQRDRTEAVEHWQDTKRALDEQASRDTDVALAQDIERDTSAAVQQALAEGNYMYADTKGANPEWDESVKGRVAAIKGIIRSAPQVELVKWVVEGLTARPLRDLLAREKDKVAKLTAELQQRGDMAPRVRGGGTPPPAPAGQSVQPASPTDFIAGLFGK